MEDLRTDPVPENEEVVRFRTGLHWVTFLGPAALLIIAGLSVPSKGVSALIVGVVALIWGVFAYLRYKHTQFRVTETRFTIKMDAPRAWKFDIPLLTIEDVDVYQPVLGKILDFGKVIIVAGKGKRRVFRMVRAPMVLNEKIRELALKARSRQEGRGKAE